MPSNNAEGFIAIFFQFPLGGFDLSVVVGHEIIGFARHIEGIRGDPKVIPPITSGVTGVCEGCDGRQRFDCLLVGANAGAIDKNEIRFGFF